MSSNSPRRSVSPSSPRRAAPPPDPASPAESERSERIRYSLPLFFVGLASLVCAYVLYTDAFASHATRVPIWVLALSVGVIASVGGTASFLVGDFAGEELRSEAERSGQFVVIDRDRWEGIQAELRGSRGSPPSTPAPAEAWPPGHDFLPEWSEPLFPLTSTTTPAAGPPAPMAVNHRMESLATEVERLVADLEATASEANAAPVPTPLAAPSPRAPSPDRGPAPSPDVLEGQGEPAQNAGSTPAPTLPEPQAATGPLDPPAAHSPALRPLPEVPTPMPSSLTEHQALLEELERRAGEALRTGALSDPSPTKAGGPASGHCVSCDAKIPAGTRPTGCRSCRSPMCTPCRSRALKAGHPNVCAVCAILEESER